MKLSHLSLLIPAGMVLLSIVYLIGCFWLNFGTVFLPAEGFLPFIVGILFLMGSGGLLINYFVMAKNMPVTPKKIERKEIINVLILVGIFFGYVILLPVLGFVLCTIPLIFVSAKTMGARWRPSVLLSMGTTIICYIIFIFWLKLPFPRPFFMWHMPVESTSHL